MIEQMETMYLRGYLKAIIDISNSMGFEPESWDCYTRSKKQYKKCLESLFDLLKTNEWARGNFIKYGGLESYFDDKYLLVLNTKENKFMLRGRRQNEKR